VADARIRGLRELDRALRRADKDLHDRLRTRLRAIATEVAAEARAIAGRKGLRKSGDLIAGIKPFVRAGSAGVRSTAVHDGYDYPRRLEYEARGAQPFGPRATLGPAAADPHNNAIEMAERLLDDLADDLERGT
jgi:hypothetical protein